MDKWIEKIELRKSKKDAGWWFKVGTAVLVAITVIVVGVRLWLKNKQITTLKVQKKLDENAQKRAKAKAEAATLTQKKTKALLKAKEAEDRAVSIDKKIMDTHNRAESDRDVIDQLKSWDDVDKHVK